MPIQTLYGRWMNRWEESLCFRANNRVVRPFEWGVEWSAGWPVAETVPVNGDGPCERLLKLSEAAMADSGRFYQHTTPDDFTLHDGVLRFSSPA